MIILKLILAVGLLPCMFFTSYAQEAEQLFKTNCASCHTIGKGKLVGPDLQNVHSRNDEQWMLKWVKSSQSLVKAGDEKAIKLFNDNNKIPMPDVVINDDQIKVVLAYIKTKSEENSLASASGSQTSLASNVSPAPETKEENVSLLNIFSFSEYLLMGITAISLIIIWVLSKTIRSLSIDLKRKKEL